MDPFYAFLLFAVVLVLEIIAAQHWVPPYFRLGVPVYFIRAALKEPLEMTDAAQALGERFTSSPMHPSIRFKAISPDQIAMREALFENRGGIRYLPVMHSVARLHGPQQLVILTGYLNWSILVTLIYIIYRSITDPSFVPVALLIVFILALSYAFQVGVTGRISQAIQEMTGSQS